MRKRLAFTLVELLVVIGIIAVLIGILLPALNRARATARTTQCLSNLRSLGQAFELYSNAFDNVVVPATVHAQNSQNDFWPILLQNQKLLPYTANQENTATPGNIGYGNILICPSVTELASNATDDKDAVMRFESQAVEPAGQVPNQTWGRWYEFSYGMNGTSNGGMLPGNPASMILYTRMVPGRPLSYRQDGLIEGRVPPGTLRRTEVRDSAATPILFDGKGINWWNGTGIHSRISGARHGKFDPKLRGYSGTTNVLFMDGHAESVPRADLPNNTPGKIPTDYAAIAMGFAKPTADQRLSRYWPKYQFRIDGFN